MPRPDMVFFLSVPEEERQRRLRVRGRERTAEETRLSEDAAFRQRVIDGYSALGAGRLDASGTPDATVDEIVRLVRQAG